MADPMTKLMHAVCGAGGIHCYCCNSYRRGSQPILRRMARRKLKAELRAQMGDL